MQILKHLFNFYIFSSIHVAVGAFCFVKITLLSFGIVENITASFVFFSTILSYNFIRFMDLPIKGTYFGNRFYKNKTTLILISVLSSIFSLYFLIEFELIALIVLAPFVVLTFFYGMKLPKKAISLRRIPGLKIFVIAFCFAGITVLFPLVQNEVIISSGVLSLFVQRLFFVILITLPFDIRDIDYDNKALKTIPQLFGVRVAKILGSILLFVVLILAFYNYDEKNIEVYIVALMSLFATCLLLFSKSNQPKYYSSFLVEALPIVWYVIFVFSLKM
ncbi:MAG: UbiA family prenyltransferase [Flavobacteriaceae bacterium]